MVQTLSRYEIIASHHAASRCEKIQQGCMIRPDEETSRRTRERGVAHVKTSSEPTKRHSSADAASRHDGSLVAEATGQTSSSVAFTTCLQDHDHSIVKNEDKIEVNRRLAY